VLKAKVFISCGQTTQEEKTIGTKLVSYFTKRGFDAYFAEEVHNSLALTQSIYSNIRTSEYFVCVNFDRKDSKYGSLFVQQELAIASFLELPLVAFHQPKIKLGGVAQYLHVNSIEFNSFKDIILNLDQFTKKWDPESKNQFRLSFGNEHLGLTTQYQEGNMVLTGSSNWYHIIVENLSHIFTAKNCYSFIESIFDLDNGREVFGQNEYKNELMWAGTGRINLNVPYLAKKDIDAIYTIQGSKKWVFQEANTSTVYSYPQLSDGKYRIVYLVHSENFPEAKIEVDLLLADDRVKLLQEKQPITL